MSDSITRNEPATDTDVDHGRRHFLLLATAGVGAVGAAFAAVPFVSSFRPSARAVALGAPVRVNLSKIELGSMARVEWRGQPVFIVRRTPESLSNMKRGEYLLADPESASSLQPEFARNEDRSASPEVFVVKGVCTHLGCAPQYVPEVNTSAVSGEWFGGFFCPCHGSKFDIAGRVYKGVPAPTNLEVPPHQFLSDDELLIGVEPGGLA